MEKAVIVSAQFLVKVPKDIDVGDIESWGCGWLSDLASKIDVIDYRHVKLAGIYLRPVPVLVVDPDLEDVFNNNNLKQL